MNSSVSLSMEPTLQPTMNPISRSPSTKTMNTSSTSAPSTNASTFNPYESTTTMEPTLNSIAFAPYMTGLQMNQSDAVQYCQSRGHDLVSIHNDFQMNVTNKLCLTRGGGCWIGLRNNDTAGDGQWIWSDGTALDYGFNDDGTPTIGQWPWDDSEPNNNYNAEDGVVLLSNGHGWNDYPGHWDTQWVICNNLSVTTSQTMNSSVIHWGDLNITGNASFTIDNGTIENGDLASSVDAHFSIIGWTYSQIHEINQDIDAFATSLTSYIHRAFADDELIEFNDVVLNISSINNLTVYDLIALDDSQRMNILMTNMSLQYHIECDDIVTCFYISDDWLNNGTIYMDRDAFQEFVSNQLNAHFLSTDADVIVEDLNNQSLSFTVEEMSVAVTGWEWQMGTEDPEDDGIVSTYTQHYDYANGWDWDWDWDFEDNSEEILMWTIIIISVLCLCICAVAAGCYWTCCKRRGSRSVQREISLEAGFSTENAVHAIVAVDEGRVDGVVTDSIEHVDV